MGIVLVPTLQIAYEDLSSFLKPPMGGVGADQTGQSHDLVPGSQN